MLHKSSLSAKFVVRASCLPSDTTYRAAGTANHTRPQTWRRARISYKPIRAGDDAPKFASRMTSPRFSRRESECGGKDAHWEDRRCNSEESTYPRL